MIKSFEAVYKEIENLFINQLPDYIDKINKEQNDGIILKPFENKNLKDNCIKQPCFTFAVEEAEYSEKDRIIENSIFECSIEIKIEQTENFIFWRYIEAIKKMLVEEDSDIIIIKVQATKVLLRIILS